MSVKISDRVWDNSQHDGTELTIMLALADHSNDDGVSWPGIARLAQKSRRSERYVRRVIRQLEQGGELVVAERAGRSNTNMYFITLGFGRPEMVAIMVKRLGFSQQRAEATAVMILETREKGGVQTPFSPAREGAQAPVNPGVQAPRVAKKGAPKVTNPGAQAPQTVMNRQSNDNRHEPSPTKSASYPPPEVLAAGNMTGWPWDDWGDGWVHGLRGVPLAALRCVGYFVETITGLAPTSPEDHKAWLYGLKGIYEITDYDPNLIESVVKETQTWPESRRPTTIKRRAGQDNTFMKVARRQVAALQMEAKRDQELEVDPSQIERDVATLLG